MSIQEQIEALTQELRPYPKEGFDSSNNNFKFWYYDYESDRVLSHINMNVWFTFPSSSTNKAEVEEYADCYRRLKLYQLLGKKAEREFPIDWSNWDQVKYSTWFFTDDTSQEEDEQGIQESNIRYACLGSVWFAREEDRLEALRICGIDAEFQKRCAKYGLGGA